MNKHIVVIGDSVEGKSYSPKRCIQKETDKKLEQLWEELEDVLFVEGNELYEENLEEFSDYKDSIELLLYTDWQGFSKGTDRESIWHWFDEQHSKGVAWLMHGKVYEHLKEKYINAYTSLLARTVKQYNDDNPGCYCEVDYSDAIDILDEKGYKYTFEEEVGYWLCGEEPYKRYMDNCYGKEWFRQDVADELKKICQ